MFRTGVAEFEHVCGRPGGCKAVEFTVPFCSFIAQVMLTLALSKAQPEDFYRTVSETSMEERFNQFMSSYEAHKRHERSESGESHGDS